MLECYDGLSSPTPLVVLRTATAEQEICASYQFRCVANETDCTEEEIQNGEVYKWSYVSGMPRELCRQLQVNAESSYPLYKNVTCCATDLCNKPSHTMDPDANIRFLNGTVVGSNGRVEPSSAAPGASARVLGGWYAALLAAAMGAMMLAA